MANEIWYTPGGQYSRLYADMAEQPHLLIAGATGSGKSVVENGILHAIMTLCSPAKARLILIDPKRVELYKYAALPHTITYASEPGDFARALQAAINIIEDRYRIIRQAGARKWEGGRVYVVIDELADLMLTDRKHVEPLIQRIAQIGRAARCTLIACTQCPLASVIPTPIKCCLDSRVGLRTRSAQDSRNILGEAGCEKLPRYGEGYYMTPEGTNRLKLHMFSEKEIDTLIDYWCSDSCRIA